MIQVSLLLFTKYKYCTVLVVSINTTINVQNRWCFVRMKQKYAAIIWRCRENVISSPKI